MMLKGQDAQIDYEFFSILDSMLAQAEAMGDEKSAERLKLLRENLMPITTFGKRVAKQQAAVESLKDVKRPRSFSSGSLRPIRTRPRDRGRGSPAARLQVLREADRAHRGQPGRGAGSPDQAARRAAGHDPEDGSTARAGIEDAVKLLGEILNSPNPRSAVREHADEIDDVFMTVLSANMQEAEQAHNEALLERFEMVYDEVMALVEDGLPPEVQLINELLRAPYPDGTRELLQEHQAEMTPEVLELMDIMADDMAQRATKARSSPRPPSVCATSARRRC